MSTIAKNIKVHREVKGLTQKELAEALGKTKNVLSNWENDYNKPDVDSIYILCKIFEIDVNTLFGWGK